ncbi:low-density lipoprotein receptor-related protein, partial [Trichonephila clavata]
MSHSPEEIVQNHLNTQLTIIRQHVVRISPRSIRGSISRLIPSQKFHQIKQSAVDIFVPVHAHPPDVIGFVKAATCHWQYKGGVGGLLRRMTDMETKSLQSVLFLALWTIVSSATSSEFYGYRNFQRHVVGLRLGDECRFTTDCIKFLKKSHCDLQKGVCTCIPYHHQVNHTSCLPASLLGYGCEADGQCQIKVANSLCSEKKCQCQRGFLPHRKDKCLP